MSATTDRIVQPLIRRLKGTADPSDRVIRALSELPFTLKSFEPGQDILRDGERSGHCAGSG